jgi:hypothetical protein
MSVSLAIGELPPSPDLVSICESSDIIVVAEPVRSIAYGSPLNIEYKIITFRLHEILKGDPDLDPINTTMINDKVVVGPLFNVIVQKRSVFACARIPSYMPKKKYILFLGCPIMEALNMRSKKDRLCEETPWSSSIEKQLQDILSVIWECDCIIDHCESSDILEVAKKEEIPLTKKEKEKKLVRKYFYYSDSKKVGERGFFISGNLAYENKMKNGKREGLCKEYYYGGNIHKLTCYKDDQRHGIMKEYDESGDAKNTSFWLSNVLVTEAEYKESSKKASDLTP